MSIFYMITHFGTKIPLIYLPLGGTEIQFHRHDDPFIVMIHSEWVIMSGKSVAKKAATKVKFVSCGINFTNCDTSK